MKHARSTVSGSCSDSRHAGRRIRELLHTKRKNYFGLRACESFRSCRSAGSAALQSRSWDATIRRKSGSGEPRSQQTDVFGPIRSKHSQTLSVESAHQRQSGLDVTLVLHRGCRAPNRPARSIESAVLGRAEWRAPTAFDQARGVRVPAVALPPPTSCSRARMSRTVDGPAPELDDAGRSPDLQLLVHEFTRYAEHVRQVCLRDLDGRLPAAASRPDRNPEPVK